MKCSERFPHFWRKVKLLLLLDLPTTYDAEQGFNQVLHIRAKYRNRLAKNKTCGNAIGIKLTNIQSASKKSYR